MDQVTNPFTPGAGTPPLVLAGRDEILQAAETALKRLKIGRSGRSQMFLGLRGVGKTVLLNHVFNSAEDEGFFTIKIEAPESGDFAERTIPELKRILLRLSTAKHLRHLLDKAGSALRNFASVFKLSYDGFEFGATPQPGVADSGDFETDFSQMMRLVLEAAKAGDRQVALFVDEVQYLSRHELAAITVTCHEAAQRGLPFIFFGAGLPQIAKLAGDAKSYAERLFEFPEIGPLSDDAARKALRQPAQDEGADFTDAALDRILERARNYPYFLQEWGSHVWNLAQATPFTADDVRAADTVLIRHLDASFFRVRFDRCKPVQQKYLRAMAELGPGPYATGDIADALGCEPSQVASTRSQLISLGMIWSQRHGETEFTVPLFDDFMRRQMPELIKHTPKKRKP